METAKLTVEYIKEHPYIKSCLKKGLINYSALARLISENLRIEKKTSLEAILVAARRYQEKLKNDFVNEKKIRDLLSDSEIEIKNKINTFIVNKNIDFGLIETLQKRVKKENGTLFILEGSESYTIIIQGHPELEKELSMIIIHEKKNLAMIKIKSPRQIENTIGVLSYLTSLFAENGVNIIEFMSSWKDTLFIIDLKDINKTMDFLNF